MLEWMADEPTLIVEPAMGNKLPVIDTLFQSLPFGLGMKCDLYECFHHLIDVRMVQ